MISSSIKREKICLFGGTFDPIHLGHTHIAETAVKALHLDKVLFLPCQISPHKTETTPTNGKHRLEMCRKAIQSFAWAEVNDLDLITPPPSYSWRTAEIIQSRYPDADLYWLMGTDQWDVISKWKHPEKLAELVRFIVFSRGKEPTPRNGYHMDKISGYHPASATEIRQFSSEKSHWLHPNVFSYIQKHKLYTFKS